MSLRIGDAVRFDDLKPADFLAFAEELRLPREMASEFLRKACEEVPRAADRVIAEFEAEAVPKGAAAVRGGEMRLLRIVRYTIIQELVRRLAPVT
jgi:serine/threonine protein kinase HipA of HipAB toxin-antitoxin module